MGIRIDATSISAVAVCECGWRVLRATRPDARTAAITHGHRHHDRGDPAFRAADQLQARAGR